MTNTPEITFLINGNTVTREEVIGHELARARVAQRRLGIAETGSDAGGRQTGSGAGGRQTGSGAGGRAAGGAAPDISALRRALLERKLALGHEQIRVLLASDTRKAALVVGALRKLSGGKVKPCRAEVFATGISAHDFGAWFEHVNATADEPALLAAHPEHYLIINTPDGLQEVIETNGGSPFAAHFTIDFSDAADALAHATPGYPYHIAGKAIDAQGRRIGGAMHQFQDTEGGGLHGVLSVDFPLLTPPAIMNGHKMHLAIEFSNWIEAAARASE